jgi:hypothetical protein
MLQNGESLLTWLARIALDGDQQRPSLELLAAVHVQDKLRYAPNRRQRHDACPVEAKMILPAITARVEEWR